HQPRRPHACGADPAARTRGRHRGDLHRHPDHLLRDLARHHRGDAAVGAPVRPGARHRPGRGGPEVSIATVLAQGRSDWEWDFAWEILPDIWDGMVETIRLTVIAISFAMVLGLLLAILRRS